MGSIRSGASQSNVCKANWGITCKNNKGEETTKSEVSQFPDVPVEMPRVGMEEHHNIKI